MKRKRYFFNCLKDPRQATRLVSGWWRNRIERNPGDFACEYSYFTMGSDPIVLQKFEQLIVAKKSERVSCLVRTPRVDTTLKKTDLPPEVVVPLTSLDCATTNKLLLVSSVWAIEKDYRECKKAFSNAVVCPVAYGNIIGNRTCNEMSISDFLPSPRGAKLVAQTLKKLLAS